MVAQIREDEICNPFGGIRSMQNIDVDEETPAKDIRTEVLGVLVGETKACKTFVGQDLILADHSHKLVGQIQEKTGFGRNTGIRFGFGRSSRQRLIGPVQQQSCLRKYVCHVESSRPRNPLESLVSHDDVEVTEYSSGILRFYAKTALERCAGVGQIHSSLLLPESVACSYDHAFWKARAHSLTKTVVCVSGMSLRQKYWPYLDLWMPGSRMDVSKFEREICTLYKLTRSLER
jgi:hypothetical protein